jgi:hypothetical protein
MFTGQTMEKKGCNHDNRWTECFIWQPGLVMCVQVEVMTNDKVQVIIIIIFIYFNLNTILCITYTANIHYPYRINHQLLQNYAFFHSQCIIIRLYNYQNVQTFFSTNSRVQAKLAPHADVAFKLSSHVFMQSSINAEIPHDIHTLFYKLHTSSSTL